MTDQEATQLAELAACPDHRRVDNPLGMFGHGSGYQQFGDHRRVGPNPPHVNATGCVVTVSHITGDVLCRWPGPDCECLMQKVDRSYAPAGS